MVVIHKQNMGCLWKCVRCLVHPGDPLKGRSTGSAVSGTTKSCGETSLAMSVSRWGLTSAPTRVSVLAKSGQVALPCGDLSLPAPFTVVPVALRDGV